MSSYSDPFAAPRPEPFRVPRTQQEISDAARDGDPLTGLEVQTAFDGSPVDEARLKAAFDGDPITANPRLQNGEDLARERTIAALDGDPMTKPDLQIGSDASLWLERRAANRANPHAGIERRARPMPTPWDHPRPTPPEY